MCSGIKCKHKYLNPDVGKKLDEAFATVGFVYISNHGIDPQLPNTVLSESSK